MTVEAEAGQLETDVSCRSRRELMVAAVAMLDPCAAWADGAPRSAHLRLWPGPAPGGGGPDGPERIDDQGAVSNIGAPSLEVFSPAHPNGAAVLIAGGGGYKRIELTSEARPAARWLASRGVTAFVLRYRLPGEGWLAGPLAPLQDAQRALRLIRAQAARRAINPERVGVLGFSAGGHLMGLAATRSGFGAYPAVDGVDAASARPMQAALVYPVVTLLPPYDHTSTRAQLVGRRPSLSLAAEWSVQTHVRARCPPMFLVQAQDDPVSDIANTALLQCACQAAGVPVERHVLASGGHGFGMGRPGTPSAQWPIWYETWLRAHAA